ncbi:phage tail tube protein [Streptomyces cinereoruber]|uniref:phage tail tube protein n=1 Tax=Streptomyces cinereoruber TaxID=67260 RepID=UPI003641B3EC
MPRFSRKGVTKVLFLETIAATTYIPTRAEITDATKLTKDISEFEGFNLENQEIETPDLESTFTSKIPGDDQAADSSLTFYEDDTSSTLEEALAKGTTGFIVVLRKGDVPASKSMDVWPVRVASKSSTITVDNEAAKFTVRFSITDTPVLDQAVPANP